MLNKEEKLYPDFERYGEFSFYEDIDFGDEKARTKFIKDIERIIRTSLEYRNYIKYLKTDAMLNYCTIFNKLPEDVANSIKIEMHHHPITLYDLVDTLLSKKLALKEAFTRISIANELMLDHYFGLIGIVPLTLTAHQLAHNGKSILKKDDVLGNYNDWINKNRLYIDEIVIKKVQHFEELPSEIVVENVKDYFSIDSTLFGIEDKTNEEIEKAFLE